jgi:hypothetical protein
MKLLLALCLLLPTLSAASLTLIPNSGNINIEPGNTYGWGFELNNDTSNYMLVTSVVASGFDPLMGTFQDFIVSVNPTILGPNTILNQAYNQALQQGFGEFAMLPGALIGALPARPSALPTTCSLTIPSDRSEATPTTSTRSNSLSTAALPPLRPTAVFPSRPPWSSLAPDCSVPSGACAALIRFVAEQVLPAALANKKQPLFAK